MQNEECPLMGREVAIPVILDTCLPGPLETTEADGAGRR
jgi:hypothetical protein